LYYKIIAPVTTIWYTCPL